MQPRASWDEYFMGIAKQVATRSTCDRKHVGAVIVRDRTIIATGYNGSIRGALHCNDWVGIPEREDVGAGHMMENDHCVRTIHAEANAIIQAAKNGSGINQADIYTTASPCWDCFKLIVNSGIIRIVFGVLYRDKRIYENSKDCGIILTDLSQSLRDSAH